MVTILSLAINTLVFILVSAITTTSDEEKAAAEVCSTDDLNRPTRRGLSVTSPAQISEQLATALGQRTAAREVKRALKELQLNEHETRPFALRRLRYRVEANLSGLLGPAVAHDMVNKLLPFEHRESTNSGEDINLIEIQLENYKTNLTGLAADLDNLRRYHRQTLQDLPVGVCSLGQDGEILMWNSAMAAFTHIDSPSVIGSNLARLPQPWGASLTDFINNPKPHLYKQHIEFDGATFWFNLHKAAQDTEPGLNDGTVIVLEDTTDLQMLERELAHNERLASIGRLAAGVAHEIGNPVTGIACLAQNLQYDTDNPQSLESAREILNQTERVSKIVQTLVNFAHSGTESSSQQLSPIELKACVDEAIHLLKLNQEAKPILFDNRTNKDSIVLGNAQQLLQVFVNLLSNARDASNPDDKVIIDEEIHDEYIRVHVSDFGSGISKEDQERIFEPFFTTKELGQGTGLGLSLVYSIIEDMNGFISVESPIDQQRGARFTLQLQHHIH
jgi:PAS domain S-box-containing protein